MARDQTSSLAPHDWEDACSMSQRKEERVYESDTFRPPSCSRRIGWREMRDRHRAILSFPETREREVATGKAALVRSKLDRAPKGKAMRRAVLPSSASLGRNCGLLFHVRVSRASGNELQFL